MKRTLDDAALSRLLRAGDPAPTATALEQAERDAMLRHILDAAPETPPCLVRRWRPMAYAAGLVMVLGLAVALLRPGTAPESGGGPRAPDAEAREIQFTIPGGTFVVWTLDPDFAL